MKLTRIEIQILAVDARKCYATGRGIQPKGVRVRDNADFKVHTEGAGVGELKVRLLFLTLYKQLAFRLARVPLLFLRADNTARVIHLYFISFPIVKSFIVLFRSR